MSAVITFESSLPCYCLLIWIPLGTLCGLKILISCSKSCRFDTVGVALPKFLKWSVSKMCDHQSIIAWSVYRIRNNYLDTFIWKSLMHLPSVTSWLVCCHSYHSGFTLGRHDVASPFLLLDLWLCIAFSYSCYQRSERIWFWELLMAPQRWRECKMLVLNLLCWTWGTILGALYRYSCLFILKC